MSRRRQRDKGTTEISMLNLIDVIFMLLIFFMIATTFNNYAQFQIEVPKTETNLQAKENFHVEIIIDRNKKCFLKIGDKIKEISIENLEEEISKLDKAVLENITLTADESLEYKIIVEAMGKLKNQNVQNVNLNIQKAN